MTGAAGEIAPGGDSSAIMVAIPTTSAGNYSGIASVTLGSDGTGIDGLAQTALGTGYSPVSAEVNNYADPAFNKISSNAQLKEVSPTAFTYDFGAETDSAKTLVFDLDVLNKALGPADALGGSYTISPTAADTDATTDGVFTNTGFSDFSGLEVGQASSTAQILFDPTVNPPLTIPPTTPRRSH